MALEVVVEIIGPVLFLSVTCHRLLLEAKRFEVDHVISWNPLLRVPVSNPHPVLPFGSGDAVFDRWESLPDEVGKITILQVTENHRMLALWIAELLPKRGYRELCEVLRILLVMTILFIIENLESCDGGDRLGRSSLHRDDFSCLQRQDVEGELFAQGRFLLDPDPVFESNRKERMIPISHHLVGQADPLADDDSYRRFHLPRANL